MLRFHHLSRVHPRISLSVHRHFSISGLPNLGRITNPDLGNIGGPPTGNIPPPRVIPSPLDQRMPPMTPQGAGIDSGFDREDPGSTTTSPLPNRTGEGIERGTGGVSAPRPRLEQDMKQPGPGRPSDTPPLPEQPPTPQDMTDRKEKKADEQRQKEKKQEIEEAAKKKQSSATQDDALPPPLFERVIRGAQIPKRVKLPEGFWEKIGKFFGR